jgi:DNA-binding NarL/FixJ family response regulator
MTDASSVLLVDDHQMIRRGLRLIIEQRTALTVVGETSTGAETIEAVSRLSPTIVLLDLHLPDMDGLDVAKQILLVRPNTRIVVLSSDASPLLISQALQVGVLGYILKENAPEELERALHTAVAGQSHFSPEVSSILRQDFQRRRSEKALAAKPELSEREEEVLRFIAAGLRTKDIANELNIGVKTAETYRRRLMNKLELKTVAELTRYAIREGLIKP